MIRTHNFEDTLQNYNFNKYLTNSPKLRRFDNIIKNGQLLPNQIYSGSIRVHNNYSVSSSNERKYFNFRIYKITA